MEKGKKLIIHTQKYGGETSVVSMRMPKKMLAEIDHIAERTSRPRNEVLMLMLEFSLDNMEILE